LMDHKATDERRVHRGREQKLLGRILWNSRSHRGGRWYWCRGWSRSRGRRARRSWRRRRPIDDNSAWGNDTASQNGQQRTYACHHPEQSCRFLTENTHVDWMPACFGLLPPGFALFVRQCDNIRMKKTFFALTILMAGGVLLGSAMAQQSTTKNPAAPAKTQSTAPAQTKTPDAPAPKTDSPAPFANQKDKVSYAIGMNIGTG